MKRSVISVALFAGIVVAAVFVMSAPAGAKPPPFSVAITASPPAYSGPCPVTIKYTGEISGDPSEKLQYQLARVVSGTPSVLLPWTNATMPATGKLVVVDTVTISAPQAGIESETLRVLPGPASATVKVSVTCVAATPTPKPKISLAGGVSTLITPAPSPQPSHTPFNPGVMLAPGARLPVALPPPINLTQALTKEVCQAHGGSAGSFACYIGLPAGKLALVWDYPYPNPIDGYNVYRADTPPPGPMAVRSLYAPKPIATQSDPSWKFVVLDAQKAGSCFAVTAYHGSDESARSVRFCIGEGGVAKMVSLSPARTGTAIVDFFYYLAHSVQDNMLQQGFWRDSYSLQVGVTHVASLFRPNGDVSQYTNSLWRGYLYFDSSTLQGRHIAQAQLHLVAGQTQGPTNGQTCLAKYGPADHLWNYSGPLSWGGAVWGGSNYQGPDLRLDVTSLVQSWADSPSSNKGIMLEGEQSLVIYNMIILPATCLTTFPSAALDVTYY